MKRNTKWKSRRLYFVSPWDVKHEIVISISRGSYKFKTYAYYGSKRCICYSRWDIDLAKMRSDLAEEIRDWHRCGYKRIKGA